MEEHKITCKCANCGHQYEKDLRIRSLPKCPKCGLFGHTKVEKEKPKEVIAWAIKDPDGNIIPMHIEDTKSNCIFNFAVTAENYGTPKLTEDWKEFKSAGYSCVKVKITEL